jgi:hypothetical protein
VFVQSPLSSPLCSPDRATPGPPHGASTDSRMAREQNGARLLAGVSGPRASRDGWSAHEGPSPPLAWFGPLGQGLPNRSCSNDPLRNDIAPVDLSTLTSDSREMLRSRTPRVQRQPRSERRLVEARLPTIITLHDHAMESDCYSIRCARVAHHVANFLHSEFRSARFTLRLASHWYWLRPRSTDRRDHHLRLLLAIS